MAATVSMAHMVDMALGTPEVGAVNFNVLHALLHAMLSKLNLSAVTAELSKEDSDLLTISDSGLGTVTGSDGESSEAKDGQNGMKPDGKLTPSRSTPYHALQKKVASLEEQMEKLNQLPTNPDLFERAKPVGDGERPRPVSDMWQNVQLKNRVDANEEGIGKLMSLVEDLMAEIAKLKEDSTNLRNDVENHNIPGLRTDVEDLKKKLEDLDIQALRDFMAKLKKDLEQLNNRMNDLSDLDEIKKKLKDLENLTNDLNNRFSNYPPAERFEDFVTWAALEESLKGIREELEPKEKIVIEMQTQTSRPSSAKKGPSEELKQMLEQLGVLTGKHASLDDRVVVLEEEMPNKADKTDLLGLSSGPTDIPDDLINQLKHLQDQLKSLSKAREKLSELEEKLSHLPDFAGMEENIEGLNMGQGDLQRMIDALRKEYESSYMALEDKLNALQELALDSVLEPEPEPEPEPERGPSPVKLPPIAGATPPPDNSGKLSELEKALHKKESEMKALQQKMKWLMQDTNKQVTDLKDHLKNVDKELQDLISQRLRSPKKPSSPVLTNSMDSEAISRMQQIVLQLQGELESLGNTAKSLIDDNNNKTKQIDNLIISNEKLDRLKADKEYVQTEVDVKADKRSVENKVNRSQFDKITDELHKMIKEMLDKLNGHEASWKNALGTINEDVDGKLDRLEFGPIRDELERRLRALARQLKELSLRDGDLEDDAAGIRKQLLRFHCISCDRPVDMTQQGDEAKWHIDKQRGDIGNVEGEVMLTDSKPIPSIPAPGGLPATRSSRPYTTFELEQIRQHARRHGSTRNYLDKDGSALKKGLRNATNFERAVIEKRFIRYRLGTSGLVTFFSQPSNYTAAENKAKENNAGSKACNEGMPLQQPGVEAVDLYSTTRACGGSHTMTHPHRRITRVTQYNNLFRDEEVAPVVKEELDIQGADGHIYRGRLDARLPSTLQQSAPNITAPQPSSHPPKMTRVIYQSGGMPRPPPTAPGPGLSPPGKVQRPNSARTIKPLPTSVPTAESATDIQTSS